MVFLALEISFVVYMALFKHGICQTYFFISLLMPLATIALYTSCDVKHPPFRGLISLLQITLKQCYSWI